jgi:ElaB/YqjD/DUF883 family membrane-anchored ribosome-binding protein
MDRDRIVDNLNEAADRARDSAGDLLNSGRAKLDDGLRQAAGRARGAYGEALENLQTTTRERPLPALGVALGVGFVIGLLAIRR